ncbi:MAG TPA: hypothetical protein VF116_17750 [Ktedonobacterales bacterium]
MPADEVYSQLIAISQSAFAEGDYDTACHALESALARAHYLQDVRCLDEINALAREQEAQLATLPLPERIPGTTDQRRHALRLILASIITEVPTMSNLIQHERDLAAQP